MWLSRLRQNLNREHDVEVLSRAYMGKENNPLYSAAMDLIVRANWNVYKEENQMCDALKELFDELYGEKIEKQIQLEKDNAKAEGKAEGQTEGQALSVLDLLEISARFPPLSEKPLWPRRMWKPCPDG